MSKHAPAQPAEACVSPHGRVPINQHRDCIGSFDAQPGATVDTHHCCPPLWWKLKVVHAALMRSYALMQVECMGWYWFDILCTTDRMYSWCFLSKILVHRCMLVSSGVCSFCLHRFTHICAASRPILGRSPFCYIIRVPSLSHSVYVRNAQLLFIHLSEQQLNRKQLKRGVFLHSGGCLHPVSGPLGKNTTSEEAEGWWSTA